MPVYPTGNPVITCPKCGDEIRLVEFDFTARTTVVRPCGCVGRGKG
jgi:hypothetical protein